MRNIGLLITLILSTVLVMASGPTSSINPPVDSKKLKRYDVKSGIVHYKMTISGGLLGSKVTGSGTEDLYFKEWGAIELVDEMSSQTTKTNILGMKSSETSDAHVMSKLVNGESYGVDFENKRIIQRTDMAMELTKKYHPEADAGDVGREMLEEMGGKMVGSEKFLSYDCEIWEVMGGQQWMYKGVVLKLEITILGIKTVKEAVSAEFGIRVPDKNFLLPDFPITRMEELMNSTGYEEEDYIEEEMGMNKEKLRTMSFNDWKKVALQDPEMKNLNDEQLHQVYNMIQKVVGKK